ncbi:Retrovirus-related Pol polyprotein from transposon 297 [Araneus ventricosus]|uniref:Retrovirus-related Pol polyprotein from transposon 297 n=1 Tax=Araneus ventricosus TaxID=182803 RepID=A0A4Y2JRS0_ARAVE|nr:Retrovirus-related Pol polyprotein from transposon 297 [Araneus ventricosus]
MLWFQRLPITTQQILSASTDKLASLALTADKIAEVSGVRTWVNSVEVESARLNRLEAQISELTSAVQQVQSNYKRFRNASPHRRYRTRFSSRNRSFCWYHSKFGRKAQKCVPLCDFSENNGASVSVFPANRSDRCNRSTLKLVAANGSSISTFGIKNKCLDLGFGRLFNWNFIVADVSRPILGADILERYGLLVDIKNRKLIDVERNRTTRGHLSFGSSLGQKEARHDKTTIDWSEVDVQAFQTCKNSIAQAALLAHPNSEAKLSLVVDASNTGIAGTLQQTYLKNTQPLAFFSRKLTQAESRYSTYDRELLAVYYSIKHFRHFLEGRDFIIYTDHKHLTFAFQQTGDKTSPRQQRHLEFISKFSTDGRYISGIQNTVADALSRIDKIGIPSEIDYEEIAQAQIDDDELLALQGANSNLVFKTISLEPHGNPLHCDVSTGNIRPYVPKAFRTTIINVIHSLAHSAKCCETTVRMDIFEKGLHGILQTVHPLPKVES